jgi:predicted transcriptional regulator
MEKNRKKISATLRQAMIDSGQTRYAISKATGISQAILSRWLDGTRGISLDTADTLADHLGLALRAHTSTSTSTNANKRSSKARRGDAAK